jgi:Ca-activated chloride channel family protein
MSFAYPVLFYALFALPLFAVAFFVQYRRIFLLVRNLSLQKECVIKVRYFYSGLFGLLSFAALVTAAAGPSLMLKYQEERLDGVDIVFAFDVSRSMNVRDVVYNGETVTRLEAARAVADGLLAVLETRHADYRYAVAVGKGEGVLAIPLTYGIETVRAMLDSLSSSAISAAGTNVEKLTLAAASAFPPVLSASYPSEKRIIVLTDGEALAGQFRHAVERAKEEGITVAAVCVGSEKGGTIPVGVSDSGAVLFLRDQSGKAVVSKAESGTLKEAVESGGGFFTGAEDIEAAIAALDRNVYGDNVYGDNVYGDSSGPANGDLPPEGGKQTRETLKKKDICFLFAALALLFFALHKYMFYTHRSKTETGHNKKNRARQRALSHTLLRALPLSLLLFPLFNSCVLVETKIRLLEGNFFVARNMLDEAETSYTRARSLAGPEDIPYTIYALAYIQLLRAENEAAAAETETEETEDSTAIPLFGQAHALIAKENADNADRITQAFRHGHGEQHRELAYRIHYNAGLAYYHAKKPEEAAWEFRQALLVNPNRIEAKRNLEISLAQLENKSGMETSEIKTARPVQEGTSRGDSVLFDFIRQKETNRWKNWAWQGEEGDPLLDY